MTYGTSDLRRDGVAVSPIPLLWWVAGLVYLLAFLWLAMRSRVYIDQVWIVEYGRRLLDPNFGWSMYMRPDGTSPPPWAWLGPLLAELSFRLGGLLPFRLLAALAGLVAAFSFARLAQCYGATSGLAVLISGTLLLDPSVVQSIQVGRADSLALAMLLGGLLLATRAADSLHAGKGGWGRLALGYGICAMAPAAWISALLLGPLAALHWAASWRSLARAAGVNYTPTRAMVAFLCVPALAFLVAVALPVMLSLDIAADSGDPWLVLGLYRDPAYFLGYLSHELSVSAVLMIVGLVALVKLRPRWLAGFLLAGIAMILMSGFYQFRAPYLLPYFAAAAALYAGQLNDPERRQWTRLMIVASIATTALFGLRVYFSLINEASPASAPWFAKLPQDSKIADYSWDFYESARQDGRLVIRSMPLIDDREVEKWLRLSHPDYIVNAIDPEATWILVYHPPTVFAASGYCSLGNFDWGGNPVSGSGRRRPPTPLLWKLGLYRDHGPYNIHVPCDLVRSEIKPGLRPFPEVGSVQTSDTAAGAKAAFP